MPSVDCRDTEVLPATMLTVPKECGSVPSMFLSDDSYKIKLLFVLQAGSDIFCKCLDDNLMTSSLAFDIYYNSYTTTPTAGDHYG